jgi:hypothetical protein
MAGADDGAHFTKMNFGLRETRLPRSSTPTTYNTLGKKDKMKQLDRRATNTLKAPQTTSSSGKLDRNSGIPPGPSDFKTSLFDDPSAYPQVTQEVFEPSVVKRLQALPTSGSIVTD